MTLLVLCFVDLPKSLILNLAEQYNHGSYTGTCLRLSHTVSAVVIILTDTTVCSHPACCGNLFIHYACECMCGRMC